MSAWRRLIAFICARPIEAALLAIPICGFVSYGSTKPPAPPVVEEKGITITEQTVDAEGIIIKWESDDKRITPGSTVFIIEARERPIMLGKTVVFKPTSENWYEIGRTTDFELAKPGVWTDKTREIRVRTVLEVGE